MATTYEIQLADGVINQVASMKRRLRNIAKEINSQHNEMMTNMGKQNYATALTNGLQNRGLTPTDIKTEADLLKNEIATVINEKIESVE